MEKPFDSLGYKAMRIVILHFLKPAIEAGERKIKARQISRWWRRASGHHEGFHLYKPQLHGGQCWTPPGSWRIRKCVHGCCEKIPRRIMHHYAMDEIKTRALMGDKMTGNWRGFWTRSACICNERPAHIIIDYLRKYNHSAMVYYILAGDYISPMIRMKISNYLTNRLCPKE